MREREREREGEERKRGVSWKQARGVLQRKKNSESFPLSLSLLLPFPVISNKRLTLVSLIETSLEPGRAFLSMDSSSASEGCCGGGEASEAEEEVEVEKNDDDDDDDDDADLKVDVNAAPLLLQAAL